MAENETIEDLHRQIIVLYKKCRGHLQRLEKGLGKTEVENNADSDFIEISE